MMKLVSMGIVSGNVIDSGLVLVTVQNCVNEILKKAGGIAIGKIQINSSLFQQNYDALTIRVIAHTKWIED